MTLVQLKCGRKQIPLLLQDSEVKLGPKFWPAGQFLEALGRALAGKETWVGVERLVPYPAGIRVHPFKLSTAQALQAVEQLCAAGVVAEAPKSTPTRYRYGLPNGRSSFNPW